MTLLNPPLGPVLAAAGLQFIIGSVLAAIGLLGERPFYERTPLWRRLAPGWGLAFALEGILQALFWIWITDFELEGPPAPPVVLLLILFVIVIGPLVAATWSTRSVWHADRSDAARPAG